MTQPLLSRPSEKPTYGTNVAGEESRLRLLAVADDLRTKPFLKWAGGKTRLLSSILPYVPSKISSYYEPFLGGGSMFFAIRRRIHGRVRLADLNAELINAWQVVRDRPSGLIRALRLFYGLDSEEQYYTVRSATYRGNVSRAARFIYLNQTAWNGLWRVNRYGVFNVPWGNRPFRGLSRDHIQAVSASLRRVRIEADDFRLTVRRAKAGDFVYFDPPYLPISDTSKFSGYTEHRFRMGDLEELAVICRRLTEKRVRWVLSNRDNPAIRELFPDARIVSFTTRRSVAAQNCRDVQPIDSPETIIVGGL